MSLKIDQDHSRFRNIVRGKIRQNLRKYISHGELIGRKGKDLVSVPIPQIDIPRFRFGDRQQGGVGQGDGDVGDPVGGDEGQESGPGKAGQDPGEHVLEVDVTLDELAAILGEELELPDIQDKGKSKITSAKDRYTGIRRVGPESLRHFKRTYREALKRMIAAGTFRADRPVVVPIPDDRRYRSWKTDVEPVANAVIIYMMDVSGSMGDEQKEIVRIESFWIDTWLKAQYQGLESRYIIHDAVAREVDRDTFFHTRESGGTMISSAYKLCRDIIAAEYPKSAWNIYPFHFSDGDNYYSDNEEAVRLADELIKTCNLFGYGEIGEEGGGGYRRSSGALLSIFNDRLRRKERFIGVRIDDKEDVYPALKQFFGRRGVEV
jgi:uncharacterized protein